ncbi:hypothetical protein DYH10_02300 [Candidatus Saccharibacteria bacterium CPR2]|nr:hypothetical protein [Candidatus Saccharibacteria bacterium CPR2]
MFIALTLIISSVQGTFGPLFVTTLSFIYFTANVTIDVIKKRFGLLRAIEYGFIALITAYLGFSL